MLFYVKWSDNPESVPCDNLGSKPNVYIVISDLGIQT